MYLFESGFCMWHVLIARSLFVLGCVCFVFIIDHLNV